MSRLTMAATVAASLMITLVGSIPALGAPTKSEAIVTVVDAGKGEKRELRYRPEVGAEAVYETSIATSVKSAMTGEMGMPTLSAKAHSEVISVEDGLITQRIEFLDAKAEGGEGMGAMIAPQMNAVLTKIRGTMSTLVIDDLGNMRSFEMEAAEELSEQEMQMIEGLKESFSQMMVVLPKEAVGKGARWDTEISVTNDMIETMQKTTYSLEELGKSFAVFRVDMDQNAEPQTITQQGMEIEVVEFISKGGGTMRADLTNPAPDQSDLSVQTDVKVRISSMGGMEQQQTMTVKVNVKREEG